MIYYICLYNYTIYNIEFLLSLSFEDRLLWLHIASVLFSARLAPTLRKRGQGGLFDLKSNSNHFSFCERKDPLEADLAVSSITGGDFLSHESHSRGQTAKGALFVDFPEEVHFL